MTATTPGQAIAPRARSSAASWLRRNLFSTWYNTSLTVVFGTFIIWVAIRLIGFLLGIDTTIIQVNLKLFMTGRFPNDELVWLWIGVYITCAGIGLFARAIARNAELKALDAGLAFSHAGWRSVARRFWPILMLVVITLGFTRTILPTLLTLLAAAVGIGAYVLGAFLPRWLLQRSWLIPLVGTIAFYFGLDGLGGVGWEKWGGFFVNIVLTIAGVTLAFPLGLMLALGRRSSLPVVRYMSVTYIELLRGVPMISLLLMGAFALGFLIPGDRQFSLFVRLLIAIVLFQSAYIAEVVRGGLQSVPKGQVEAAQSLGLTPWKTMRLIVLPQALRNTIPAMVGQFISLFKDTTLVSIVKLLDLLLAAQNSTAQPEFQAQGLQAVTLPFAALFFWVGCFVMSRESRRLERKLGVGER
jgi:general L-amino acid transport system permease protein